VQGEKNLKLGKTKRNENKKKKKKKNARKGFKANISETTPDKSQEKKHY